MKVIWAVLAEGSSVDRDTNNVSLFNVVEEMHVPAPPENPNDPDVLPLVPVRLVLVTLFARSATDQGETQQARLVVGLPGGRIAETDPHMDVDLESALRHRNRFNLGAIPIAGEGEYSFQIQRLDESNNWNLMFEVPLHVSYLDQ